MVTDTPQTDAVTARLNKLERQNDSLVDQVRKMEREIDRLFHRVLRTRYLLCVVLTLVLVLSAVTIFVAPGILGPR